MKKQPRGSEPGENTVTPGWVPEFEGQRPPFGRGNTLAVRHGASSPAIVDPVVQSLVSDVLGDPATAYLGEPRYQPALVAWATAEAKAQLIGAWVDRLPIESAGYSARGQMSPLELYRKWSVTAMNHRGRLGLDPLSAARLGKGVSGGGADVALELTKLRAFFEGGGDGGGGVVPGG